MMNANAANRSLTDLLVNPAFSSDELFVLRSNLRSFPQVYDGLEYFLFTRISQLRKTAAQSVGEHRSLLQHQADALVDVVNLLFGELEEKQAATRAAKL